LGDGDVLDSRIARAAADAYSADLSRVRVHVGAGAARLASQQGARAFAIGEHIAFAPGQYRPGTPEGDALIAHELAHVVQQQHVGPAVTQRKKLDEDSALEPAETEADDAVRGVLARLYGGTMTAVRGITKASNKLALRRCTGPSLPADPLVRSLY